MILTWRSIKDRLALSMGMCNDNPELLRLANEAEERLLNRPVLRPGVLSGASPASAHCGGDFGV
jgi:hypothetical protein